MTLLPRSSGASCHGAGAEPSFQLLTRSHPAGSWGSVPSGLPGVWTPLDAAPRSHGSSHWSHSKQNNIRAEVPFLRESKHRGLFPGISGRREVLDCDLGIWTSQNEI